MSDSENIKSIENRIKRIQTSQNIQTVFLIMSIFGIVSLGTLILKAKRIIK